MSEPWEYGFTRLDVATRDGHPIDLHYWDGKATAVYVRPLPSDMAREGEPTCGWTPEEHRQDTPCGLKPNHTCGHAINVRMHYDSLYAEREAESDD